MNAYSVLLSDRRSHGVDTLLAGRYLPPPPLWFLGESGQCAWTNGVKETPPRRCPPRVWSENIPSVRPVLHRHIHFPVWVLEWEIEELFKRTGIEVDAGRDNGGSEAQRYMDVHDLLLCDDLHESFHLDIVS